MFVGKNKTDIISFNDKELLRELVGARHANLAIIEQAFDVYLEAQGGSIVINGKSGGRKKAKTVIEEIYNRLEKGWPCGAREINELVRNHGNGNNMIASEMNTIIPFPRSRPIIPKTKTQEAFIKAMQKNTITFGVGPAGTGKTFLATAYGASLLQRGEIKRFIACRPAVEAGEKLGFLPGDMMEKIDPYLMPIWDALSQVLGKEQLERRRSSGEIEIIPLAFMRGRTLDNAFVVIDEAQNATIQQMKMALTRLGENAAYAVTGDPSQSDLADTNMSGLVHALEILKNIDDIAQIKFSEKDIVRHPLVGKIVRAYDKDAKQ